MARQDSGDVDLAGECDDPKREQSEGAAAMNSGGRSSQPPRYRPLWNNLITMTGMFLAITALLGLFTFGLFNLVAPAANPYVDIVGYLVVPGILLVGLVAMPLGILVKSWKLHRRDPQQRVALHFPRIDLHDPIQRRAAKFVVVGTFILLPVVGVSSYHGYHYTDSAEFCSEACHAVMQPQAATYAQSSHARVACAECHIGSGASWLIRSKLSGTRQVLAVLCDTYSRPIPPAIRHLRPARETCEQCHWPERFFGDQLIDLTRFASDESNSRREIKMLLKTGGGSRSGGRIGGIHMHVALAGRIEYVATDDKLQIIPWVKMTDFDGHEVIYRSDGQPHADSRPAGMVRHMDCVDCHNRPAHNFRAPAAAVDVALREGTLDLQLPYVKREAVAALVRPYPDEDSAEAGIAATLSGFYSATYPKVWRDRRASVRQAIETVTQIHRGSFFAAMNVDWRTYPDNIGHKISPGCFRCHDGQHIDHKGHAISHACHTCHTFLNLDAGDADSSVLHEGEFIHPAKLQGRHAELLCDRCHTGGVAPQATCVGCHTEQAGFRAATLAAFERFDIPTEPMADDVACEDCHDLSKPTEIAVINDACVDCHDEEYEGMPASWKQEVDQLLRDAEAGADAEGKRLLRTLRRAGPLHNVEATRILARTIADAG